MEWGPSFRFRAQRASEINQGVLFGLESLMGFSQPARLRIQDFKLWQGVVNYAHVAMFRVQDLEISEFVHVHKRVKVIVTIMITKHERTTTNKSKQAQDGYLGGLALLRLSLK